MTKTIDEIRGYEILSNGELGKEIMKKKKTQKCPICAIDEKYHCDCKCHDEDIL